MNPPEDSAPDRAPSHEVVAFDPGAERLTRGAIYPQLVQDENDLVGLVAYGLYKRRKRAWIKAFREEHQKYPSSQECDGFSFGYRKDALAALRKEAEGAMATFAEQVIENNIEEMKREALDAKTQSILGDINSKLHSLGGYGHHIVGHLIGFVVLVGIVALGTFILNFEPSIDGAYKWVFGKKIEHSAPATTKPEPEQK